MWQTLTQMYGGSFLTAFGENDAPPAVWRGALGRLTRAEAKAGIATLAKQARAYPPNLTEVLEACRPKKLVRYLGVPTTPARLRLPRPKASDEVRGKHLAHMRSVLSGRTEDEPDIRAAWDRPACTCKGSGECEACRRFATILDEVAR